jgi:hypothetical protein
MTYVRKHKEVEAIKLNAPIYGKDGYEMAPAGYWLVTEGKEQYYMSDESFLTEFEIKREPNWTTTTQPPYVWSSVDYCVSEKSKLTDNTDKVEYFSGDLPPGHFVFVTDNSTTEAQ